MEEQLENAEGTVETAEEKQESAEEKPEGAEKEPESMKAPEGAEKEPESMKAPEGAEKEPEGMEKEPEGVEKEPEGAGKKPEGMEKATEGAEKSGAAEGTDKEEKRKALKKKIAGCMELAAAFLLAALSLWMFINTRGTRMLHVSVMTGRICRYYWIFLAVAVLFGLLGAVTLKGFPVHRKAQKADEKPEIESKG